MVRDRCRAMGPRRPGGSPHSISTGAPPHDGSIQGSPPATPAVAPADAPLAKAPTGITGFDDISGGGLPTPPEPRGVPARRSTSITARTGVSPDSVTRRIRTTGPLDIVRSYRTSVIAKNDWLGGESLDFNLLSGTSTRKPPDQANRRWNTACRV